MSPAAFRELMERFFNVAFKVLVEHDAIVDKFVGDEVVAIFIPGLAGNKHAERAIRAGRLLLRAMGDGRPQPWLPVGVGVNSGIAYVGAVGAGEHVELSAMGDPVNVAARLASLAAAGELLVTSDALRIAGLPDRGLEHRQLKLKGKTTPTEVVVLHADGQDR